MRHWKKIKLKVSSHCVFQAMQQMEHSLSRDSLYQKEKGKIHIILDEILSNIVKFAYPTKEGKIFLYFKKNQRKNTLKLCFMDWGVSFNPLHNTLPDLTSNVEEKKVGGLGIYMVIKLANEIKYKRSGCKNILFIEIGEKKNF